VAVTGEESFCGEGKADVAGVVWMAVAEEEQGMLSDGGEEKSME
jgi:hypothetical protein